MHKHKLYLILWEDKRLKCYYFVCSECSGHFGISKTQVKRMLLEKS